MTIRFFAASALFLATACASSIPDSNPAANNGVGFGGYGAYSAERAIRDAELQRQRPSAIPEEQAIAQETLGVLNAQPIGGTTVAASTTGGTTNVQTTASNNTAISDEQNFDAVSSRETIESDRERLAQQRQAYTVATPEALPERSGSGGTNIVAYALATSNQVGESIHRRSGNKSKSRFERACARYGSSDQAQIAFLRAGGPKRDSKGLDPDGDGFACYWDPRPFRAARKG